MKYFAYGSNMSIARLRKRVPSAESLGCFALKQHDLRFHKSSKDGSGKCDAFYTGDDGDTIFGALFEISVIDKPSLDRAEGLGYGYDEKDVIVHASGGSSFEASTYIATAIDGKRLPYSWYLNHVLIGANEMSLPDEYVQSKICTIQSIHDPSKERDLRERAIHS